MKKEMLNIAVEAAKMHLSNQISTVDAVDQKVGITLGFNGVILAILFGQTIVGCPSKIFYTIGLIALLASLIYLFRAHRAIQIDTGLTIKGYHKLIKQFEPKQDMITFLRYQLKYYAVAIERNNKVIQRKNYYLYIGAIALIIGLFSFLISCQL